LARKSLRPQLNQIRAWKQQGRTDAWIAHQLEVSTSQLRDFTRRNSLEGDGEAGGSEVDLRDEIEAEIEAAEAAEAEKKDEEVEDEGRGKDDGDEDRDADGEPRRRRRRRRGGRGRGRRRRRPGAGMEATFEHGDGDKGAYGLWLDDSIKDDPIYVEHWAEQTELRVTFEPDRIVLERPRDQQGAADAADEDADADADADADKGTEDEDEDRDERDDLEGGSDANVGEEDDEDADEDEDEK
jgi:hypothetical protein